MSSYIERRLDKEVVSDELRDFLVLWGSDDCRFEIKEIAEILGKEKQWVYNQLYTLKVNYPNAYKFYAKKRQQFRNQTKSEEGRRLWSNDFIDYTCSWEREDKPNFIFDPTIKNTQMDENFYNHAYYTENE